MDINIIPHRYKEFIDHGISPDDALYLVRMMFELTYQWFERYIAAYYHFTQKYYTKTIWGIKDGGIDIIGSKVEWHKEINLLAQCKKWTYDHVQKKEILNFDYDIKHSNKNKLNTKQLFVTATRANKDARKVAKEYGIEIIDCHELLKFRSKYSLDDFIRKYSRDRYKKRTYRTRFFKNINVKKIIEEYQKNKLFSKKQYPKLNTSDYLLIKEEYLQKK